ncbi:MAG: histidine phosphatase family protein [Candidatus Omnitrophica bacterium]|nr:histidine phosphatase family protein [Candidatus Omnitrophota bacterium]
MTTRLILIRHGVTEWNKQKRYCGCKNIGLSNHGKAQAMQLRNRFNGFGFDKIYCSDRKRALQTRAILFGKADFTKVKNLREIDFGVFEGLRHDEVLKKYPKLYKEWLADPYKARIPQAEQMRVFKKRVDGTIKGILQANRGKTIALVCHGGVIGIFVSGILKNRSFWKFVPSPASVTVVEYNKNKLRLKKFNQIQGRFSIQSRDVS